MNDREHFIERMSEQLAQMREQVADFESTFRAASERIKAEFDEEWMKISFEFQMAEEELQGLKATDKSVREEMQSELLVAWKHLGRQVDEFRSRISDE